ncbi:MAG: hypothetical protein U5R14_13885 [Gemmatimonadota bacterium]|nr:hypothetical protein [Gemmatimonadota bacterium]
MPHFRAFSDANERVTYFAAALASPILGVLLYRSLHGRDRAVRLVDGFVYVAVPVLVAIQVLPEAIEDRAPWLLLVVAAGALVPTAFERASRSLADYTDNLTILVSLSGLIVHAGLEGALLAPGVSPIDPAFGWAVVLHRIPLGLVIWWLVRPRHGTALAAAAVGSLVLATLVGAFVGGELSGHSHGSGFEYLEAFVAGTLLHVVFHQGRHDHTHGHDHVH